MHCEPGNAAVTQPGSHTQRSLAQLGMLQDGIERDRPRRGRLVEQMFEGNPVHVTFLTRWRINHSPANNSPISR